MTPITSNRKVSPGFSKRDIQTFADRLSSRCFRQLTALTGPPKSSEARVFTSTNATFRPDPSRSAPVANHNISLTNHDILPDFIGKPSVGVGLPRHRCRTKQGETG